MIQNLICYVGFRNCVCCLHSVLWHIMYITQEFSTLKLTKVQMRERSVFIFPDRKGEICVSGRTVMKKMVNILLPLEISVFANKLPPLRFLCWLSVEFEFKRSNKEWWPEQRCQSLHITASLTCGIILQHWVFTEGLVPPGDQNILRVGRSCVVTAQDHRGKQRYSPLRLWNNHLDGQQL